MLEHIDLIVADNTAVDYYTFAADDILFLLSITTTFLALFIGAAIGFWTCRYTKG
jgi:hypothetical protein